MSQDTDIAESEASALSPDSWRDEADGGPIAYMDIVFVRSDSVLRYR